MNADFLGERVYVRPYQLIPLYTSVRKITSIDPQGERTLLTIIPDNKRKDKYILLSGYDQIISAYLHGRPLLFEAKIVIPTNKSSLVDILLEKEKTLSEGIKSMTDILKKIKKPQGEINDRNNAHRRV